MPGLISSPVKQDDNETCVLGYCEDEVCKYTKVLSAVLHTGGAPLRDLSVFTTFTPEPPGSGLTRLEALMASWNLAPANQSQGTAPPPGNMDPPAGALRYPTRRTLEVGVPRPGQAWVSSSEAPNRPLPLQSWGYPQLHMGHRPLPTLAPWPQVTGREAGGSPARQLMSS